MGKNESTQKVPIALGRNAMSVLTDRYLIREGAGKVRETPADLFRRVAETVAYVEERWGAFSHEIGELEDKFYTLMASGKFLPNSPTLMNAGRGLGMLSACFVLPLEDSIAGIMETARQVALVQKAGGGTGLDFSALRPKGSVVRSSGGTTEGPIAFLKMLSGVTVAIQQGAFRRGANMGVMRVDHPDILAFIKLKSDLAQVTNYNLSVAVTDHFMATLAEAAHKPHVVVNPHTGEKGLLNRDGGRADYGVDTACDGDRFWTTGEIWDLIVDSAWQTGDPGLIFIDEINRHNPTPHLGPIRATNPCGEQPLLPYEACNLGSINLSAFFSEDACGAGQKEMDWASLQETVQLAIRFLDNVVEVNRYPTREIGDAARRTRKIGLGVMGFADLLFKARISYDSDEALELADTIGQSIRDAGWIASERLATERGKFPAWKGSLWDTEHQGLAMRNAQVTTVAPTGTVSIIAGCSSGIEPVFSLAFQRNVLDGKKFMEVNPVFETALRAYLPDEERISKVLEHAAIHGSIQGDPGVPKELKAVFRTARDIPAEWHVRMQAVWQRHTDAAVSKTVNLPENATKTDVDRAFRLAHELKCKGITVYRDGCRTLQPMTLKEKPEPTTAKGESSEPMKLPEIIPSIRLRQQTPFGNMHLHISVEPTTGRERELFAQLGKGGDLANSDLEAICRLVSLLLRSGGDLRMVIDQLENIGSSLSVPARGGRVRSLADGLARALQKYLAAKERDGLETLLSGRMTSLDPTIRFKETTTDAGQESLFKIKCPDCNAAGSLAFEEGCLKCHACGYSIC